MDCLYKTASVAWYQYKLVPAQHSFSLPKHPSFPQNIWGSPSYQHAPSNRHSLTIWPSICTSALYNPLSSCYISFPHPQSICIIFFLLLLCWVTKVQQSRNVNSLVVGPSSHSSSLHRSFWILVPLQHCSRRTDRFVCLTVWNTWLRGFSCISAAACSESTPYVYAGLSDSPTSAGSWVWRFWRHDPRWYMSIRTHLSGNKGWSWCGRGKSWSVEIKQFIDWFIFSQESVGHHMLYVVLSLCIC